jgi:hypothetical protein
MSTLDPTRLDLRLIVARALAATHGVPLGFHDEEDQLEFDRQAQETLRELNVALSEDRP